VFNINDAKKRIAELGVLQGPIIVADCGDDGLAGEVYYHQLTVGVDRKIRALQRTHPDTCNYRELLLRSLDKEGDRIWEDEEITEILNGGIDPIDVAFIVGSMYAGDKAKKIDLKSGPFNKASARKLFEDNDCLYGPVNVPGIGPEDGPLEIYYRPNNGLKDAAISVLKIKNPDDWDIRLLIQRARTKDDKPMFKTQHLPTLASALKQEELTRVTAQMMHPRFMPEQVRIELAVAQEANQELHVDDLKNS